MDQIYQDFFSSSILCVYVRMLLIISTESKPSVQIDKFS